MFAGNLPEGVTGKDVALRFVEGLGEEGGLYRSFEFVGEGLPSMPIHYRLTIRNLMGVAKAGLFRRQQYDLRATDRGFGFVSTGVCAGGVLAPVLFGWIIDQGHPGWVFGLLGILTMVGLVTVLVPERSRTV